MKGQMGVRFNVVAPYQIQPETYTLTTLPPDNVLVEPVLSSVCVADLRYFTGRRDPAALAKKLPLALLHESVAKVVSVGHQRHASLLGRLVVVVPNLPCYLAGTGSKDCPYCRPGGLGANYCPNARFMSSDVHGMAATAVSLPAEQVVPVPSGVNPEAAVMTELLTVAYGGIRAAQVLPSDHILILGAGSLGYLTVLVLRYVVGHTADQITVVDPISARLDRFTGLCGTKTTDQLESTPPAFTVAFECVGGNRCADAIDLAIASVQACGRIILMGVSEVPVPVYTRNVLAKGLTLRGVSRSPRQDYDLILKSLEASDFQQAVIRVIARRCVINSEADVLAYFFAATEVAGRGKAIGEWNLNNFRTGAASQVLREATEP